MANETFRMTPTSVQRVPFSFMGSQQQEINMDVIKEKPTREQTQRDYGEKNLSPNASTIKRNFNNETDIELQNNPFYLTPIDSETSNQIQRTHQVESNQRTLNNSKTFNNSRVDQRSRSLLQKQQQLSIDDINTSVKQTRIRDITSIQVNVFEEKECKFCKEQDWSTNLIRPCHCKGNQQYVHTQCIQNEIESNYMDYNRRQFIKRLQCDICKFYFVIKTYKQYNLIKSLKDPLKFNRLFWLLSFGIILLTIVAATLTLIIINQENLQQNLEVLISTVFGCFICLILVLILIFNIFELIVIFEWKIMDRQHQTIQDNGLRMSQDELNLMLELARQKLNSRFSKVYPFIQQQTQVFSPIANTA